MQRRDDDVVSIGSGIIDDNISVGHGGGPMTGLSTNKIPSSAMTA